MAQNYRRARISPLGFVGKPVVVKLNALPVPTKGIEPLNARALQRYQVPSQGAKTWGHLGAGIASSIPHRACGQRSERLRSVQQGRACASGYHPAGSRVGDSQTSPESEAPRLTIRGIRSLAGDGLDTANRQRGAPKCAPITLIVRRLPKRQRNTMRYGSRFRKSGGPSTSRRSPPPYLAASSCAALEYVAGAFTELV